ncbi:HAD-IIIA family hydrolase [Nocardioides caldifontis]|uniref:HAD-IIIA family hydrolase n=1 Tax=Nocardioides caldifontis TaxID=2588938 RepID=UPI0011DF8C8C|nr:HAD-IIIA family hydrolase [Nocardioides caldifontis]
MSEPLTSIVVPTVGRPSLRALLEALTSGTRPVPGPVVVVDDRRDGPDLATELDDLAIDLRVVRSGGGGPARARNIGWRHARTPWVSFLDDDVVTDPDWAERLSEDLSAVPSSVAGSQGRVRVPLPLDRRPTDWERTTAGLVTALWITADMSYRRAALVAVGGFDERFPRAFREDADLGLRITGTQGEIVRGSRWITHPVRPVDDRVSVRVQAGNADDFLMRALHGRDWRARASAPRGRRGRHVAITAAAAVGVAGALTGHPRPAVAGAAGWLAGTAELAWARIAPGPRDASEVRRMVLTSAVIPVAATYHSVRGAWRHRGARPWHGVPDLVLLDRDGTLVHDVPYNGDPAKVSPVDDARQALDRLRGVGVRVGVVSNQSGIGSGLLTHDQVQAVNTRVEELLGPFDVWRYCPHDRDEGCDCRKPAPGMVKAACDELGVPPERTVLVGDIGSDVAAAEAAGAHGLLVPTPHTRAEEVTAADHVATTLTDAVDDLLAGRW